MEFSNPFIALKNILIKPALSSNFESDELNNVDKIKDERTKSILKYYSDMDRDDNNNRNPLLKHKKIRLNSADSVMEISRNSSKFSMRGMSILSRKGQIRRKKKYSKTTKVLLTISTTFLILHCPIAICKIWYFIKSSSDPIQETSTNKSIFNSTTYYNADYQLYNNNNSSFIKMTDDSDNAMEANPIEEIIERITCYLYYLNFSLNFFLYTLNGSKFRDIIIRMFRGKSKSLRKFKSNKVVK